MTREEYTETLVELAKLSTTENGPDSVEYEYLAEIAAEYEAEYWRRTYPPLALCMEDPR